MLSRTLVTYESAVEALKKLDDKKDALDNKFVKDWDNCCVKVEATVARFEEIRIDDEPPISNHIGCVDYRMPDGSCLEGCYRLNWLWGDDTSVTNWNALKGLLGDNPVEKKAMILCKVSPEGLSFHHDGVPNLVKYCPGITHHMAQHRCNQFVQT